MADAQGAVRYGIYQMTRAIRMAGAGGLYVTQAVLNHADRSWRDHAAGSLLRQRRRERDRHGTRSTASWPVRPGTDMIEVRGVLFSPLLGFDQQTGCARLHGHGDAERAADHRQRVQRTATTTTTRRTGRSSPRSTPTRPAPRARSRCSSSSRTRASTMHSCGDAGPPIGLQRYPQPPYNVGVHHQRRRTSSPATRSAPWTSAARSARASTSSCPRLTPRPRRDADQEHQAGRDPGRHRLLHHDGPTHRPGRHPPVPRPGHPARRQVRGDAPGRRRRGHADRLRNRPATGTAR